jgi:hypothetical protein
MGTVGSSTEVNVTRDVELITNLYLMPRLRIVELCFRSPIRLHGVVPNFNVRYKMIIVYMGVTGN